MLKHIDLKMAALVLCALFGIPALLGLALALAQIPLDQTAEGLYGAGNTPPQAHHDELVAAADTLVDTDVVVVCLGHSIASQIACCRFADCGPCDAESLINQYPGPATLINGCHPAQFTGEWTPHTHANYVRVLDEELTPRGLTDADVDVVVFRSFVPYVVDYLYQAQMHAVVSRTIRTRYPNCKLLFLCARVYGGHANPAGPSPEPHAYHMGLAVREVIRAQIDGDPAYGDLTEAAAPRLAWLSYDWDTSAGPEQYIDGLHLSSTGVFAVVGQALDALRTSPYTHWAWTRGDCNRDGPLDLADAVAVLQGGTHPRCDHNGDGAVDIADAVSILNALFN